MTVPTDAASPEQHPTVAVAARPGPLVYLGMRRGWWVVVSVLLLAVVDAVPTVGPYLALAQLMWLVSGLAHAKPRAARVARRPAQSRRAGADGSRALTSS